MNLEPGNHPHRRRNPLTGDWILVSPQRTSRPWQGRLEAKPATHLPSYDPDCYLCPGNRRANGAHNPDYAHGFVFTNDFAALLPDSPASPDSGHPLLKSGACRGTCRVICFSPRHDLTLADMSLAELDRVVALWAGQVEELGRKYRWVQLFENKGAAMGCSNPHPHGQVWASDQLPSEIVKEADNQRGWLDENGSVLLVSYLDHELSAGERLVASNDSWRL